MPDICPNCEAERPAFERWIISETGKGPPPEEIVRRKPNGDYAHKPVEWMWSGWAARAALARAVN